MKYAFIGNLLKYMCAKNYQNRETLDKTIAKINRCSFFASFFYLSRLQRREVCE